MATKEQMLNNSHPWLKLGEKSEIKKRKTRNRRVCLQKTERFLQAARAEAQSLDARTSVSRIQRFLQTNALLLFLLFCMNGSLPPTLSPT